MGRVKNAQFWESQKYNNAEFIQYYNRLMGLSISMFEWINMPKSVDTRFLEMCLFGEGMAVFFKDDVLGFLALRCMIGGRLNVYQIPMERRAYATNGYQMELDETNSVIIFNNEMHTNSALDVEIFAKRLFDIDRTIEVNVKAQKTPILINCDETQRLTMKNAYMQFEGNQPVIYGDNKNISPNSIQVINTEAPYHGTELYDLKIRYYNEVLTYLGISNISFQKKERMVSDEVIRNMGGTIANRYSRLNARKQACRMINELFADELDDEIDCVYREDYREADDEIMFKGESEQVIENNKENTFESGSAITGSPLAIDLRTE